jgi:hypothetical protein
MPGIITTITTTRTDAGQINGFRLLVLQCAFEQSCNLLGSVFKLPQLSFGGSKLIRKMKAGKHGHACGIPGRGTTGNRNHQLIDLTGDLFYLTGILVRKQRIRLIEDVDANGLPGHAKVTGDGALSPFYAVLRRSDYAAPS